MASAAYAWPSVSQRKASAASAPIRSLAVLPLDNLSSNTDEMYFADGMTDELITKLAKISSLRVISRTSVMRYRSTHKLFPKSRANSEWMPSSRAPSFVPAAESALPAQLIDGASDRHLWAEEYERGAGCADHAE